MSRSIVAILTLVLISMAAYAQSRTASMVDEFSNDPCEVVRGRLDTFLTELQNSPNSVGFVYVYEGKYLNRNYSKKGIKSTVLWPKHGEAALLTHAFRQHVIFRKFDPKRVLFISGGFREFYTVELWLVAERVMPPPATPTRTQMIFRKGTPTPIDCNDG